MFKDKGVYKIYKIYFNKFSKIKISAKREKNNRYLRMLE